MVYVLFSMSKDIPIHLLQALFYNLIRDCCGFALALALSTHPNQPRSTGPRCDKNMQQIR